jgi:nitrile hydratase subunit beta
VNSAHDVGGMHGFGPVVREDDEPVFHADWEKGAVAMNLLSAAQGLTGSLDSNRHAIERMGNVNYLSTSYYEHWIAGTETRLIENGIITEDELQARFEAVRKEPERFVMPPAGAPDELSELAAAMVKFGASTLREIDDEPRFAVGDEVVTTRRSPTGHTRLPRYARGRRGQIVLHHGAHVFPDTNAHDLGECPEHLYTVRFGASELWGDAAEGPDAVHIDLWESYLSPAGKEDA